MSKKQPSIEDLLTDDTSNDKDKTSLNYEISRLKIKEKEDILAKHSKENGILYINLVGFAIGPEALKLIPLEDCKKDKLVCFLLLEGHIRIGALNPKSAETKKWAEKVELENRVDVELYHISDNSLKKALTIYERLPKVLEVSDGVTIDKKEIEALTINLDKLDDFEKLLKDRTTSNLLMLVIASAVKMRASDIHLEPIEHSFVIRFRIDGMLHTIAKLSDNQKKLVTSRIKLLAALKLNIVDAPQDGRFTIYLQSDRIDVRVSSLPTNYGESISMRLLSSAIASLKLESLGFNTDAFSIIEDEIKKPSGMIISSGPTGSGKTTTLYAIINKIKNPETKIITIEDPIEYRMDGISQSQVNPKKDYTFAKGLKSLVRQDPDILLVGEIRDLHTAEIAIQAALTGHLILTTLHTNRAVGTVARMPALGVKPFLLAPALNTILGQRLVRILCTHCKKEGPLEEKDKARVLKTLDMWPQNSSIKKPVISNVKFFHPVGCEKCMNFGYRGRIGIFEIIRATDEMKSAITKEKSTEQELQTIAGEQGSISLVQDGILKAIEGTTSIAEVFRVVM